MTPSPMPWIKLYTEMLDDAKIGRMTEVMRYRFIELMLLAGECDRDGWLISGSTPMTIDDIAWRLRKEQTVVEETLNQLREIGIAEYTDGAWLIVNFAARQGRPQREKREQWRDAQDRRRSVINESYMTHAPREEKSRVEKSREEEEESHISSVQQILETVIGLPVVPADMAGMDELERLGITVDDVRGALQWRVDNNHPPVKTLGQLFPGIKTQRSIRVQGSNARASPAPARTNGKSSVERMREKLREAGEL